MQHMRDGGGGSSRRRRAATAGSDEPSFWPFLCVPPFASTIRKGGKKEEREREIAVNLFLSPPWPRHLHCDIFGISYTPPVSPSLGKVEVEEKEK